MKSQSQAMASAIASFMSRLFLRLAALSFSTEGISRLGSGPAVLAVNHASYLDGVILCAALPGTYPYVFAAKKELTRHWFPHWFLTGIDDFKHSFLPLADFARMIDKIPVFIIPEWAEGRVEFFFGHACNSLTTNL